MKSFSLTNKAFLIKRKSETIFYFVLEELLVLGIFVIEIIFKPIPISDSFVGFLIFLLAFMAGFIVPLYFFIHKLEKIRNKQKLDFDTAIDNVLPEICSYKKSELYEIKSEVGDQKIFIHSSNEEILTFSTNATQLIADKRNFGEVKNVKIKYKPEQLNSELKSGVFTFAGALTGGIGGLASGFMLDSVLNILGTRDKTIRFVLRVELLFYDGTSIVLEPIQSAIGFTPDLSYEEEIKLKRKADFLLRSMNTKINDLVKIFGEQKVTCNAFYKF